MRQTGSEPERLESRRPSEKNARTGNRLEAPSYRRLAAEHIGGRAYWRPSILDNFGLFAALRWQLKKTWGHSDVMSTENFPDVEPQFESRVATSLFRIAQEALSIALKRASVKSTDLTVCVDHGNFSMRFSDDGVPSAEMRTEDPAMILASIRHRIRMLGGSLQFFSAEAGATVLTVSMPLSNIVSA